MAYYVSSGVTSTGINLWHDSMYVYDGGTANITTVNSDYYGNGTLDVSSGGTANSTTVNYGGYLYVSSGGTANSTTVNYGALTVSSGGTADNTTINDNGRLYISSGGTANDTTVNNYGSMYVESGGTATGIVASSGASLDITVAPDTYIQGTSAGSAFEMKNAAISGYTVNGGHLYVSSGGTANSTTVNSYGYLYVSSGGTANSTTINDNGRLYISSGGTANDTTVNNYGSMYVESGGTATGIVASSGASLDITVAPDTYIQGTSAGSAFEMKNAAISGYTVNGGHLYVSSGGTANDTTVNGGHLYVSSGGTANSTTVNSYGYLYVSSGGTANSTTVNDGGWLVVLSGGTALLITENGGYVDVADGATVTFAPNSFSGLVLSYRSATVHSGTTAVSTTVNGGSLTVSSGGTANATTVNDGGHLIVSSGGTANSTTVNSWGSLYVSSGGTANSTTINAYGQLYVSSGGTALNVVWIPCVGRVDAADGAIVTYASQYSGVYFGSDNTLLSSAMILTGIDMNNASMYIMSGGTANETTVNSDGYLTVSSGGTANQTTVSGWSANMTVSSGGTANETTVNSAGNLVISSGGMANSTTVNSAGNLVISSGGTANETTVNSDGYLTVSSGGMANSTTVNAYGYLTVSSGGTANFTTVNSGGKLYVWSGCTANNNTILASGYLWVESGGTVGGLQIEDGAVVSAYAGATINFDLTGRTPADAALVNNLARVQGAPDYTITVSATQAEGTYRLADGAADFAGTISIRTGEQAGGNLTVGNRMTFAGLDYTLRKDADSLLLCVEDLLPPNKPTASASTSDPTNQVTVYAEFSEDSVKKEYSRDNLHWTAYTNGVKCTENGTVYFRATDAAGNVSDIASYAVTNIDKIAPAAPVWTAISTTAPTNRTVTVTATFSDDSAVREYSLDGNTWAAYTTGAVLSSNGTVRFRGTDAAGNRSEIMQYSVVNIVNARAGLFRGDRTSAALVSGADVLTGAVLPGAGDLLLVYSGGTANSITVNRDGSLFVSNGGTANGLAVSSGGTLAVHKGGAVSGTLNFASGAVVTGGGRFFLASDTFVAAGVAGQTQDQSLIGASTFSNFVAQNDWQVASGFLMKDARVVSGGTLTFDPGASATMLSVEGAAVVSSGANVRSATVSSGGSLRADGGLTAMMIVRSGGTAELINGGSGLRNTLFGTQRVHSGGVANSTTLYAGGVQEIGALGLTRSDFISSGGSQLVDGGSSYLAEVLPGGSQVVTGGGTATETSVTAGFQFVHSGGLAESTTVTRGSQYLSSGGTARDTAISGVMTSRSLVLTSDYHYTGDRIYWTREGDRTVVVSSAWRAKETATATLYYYEYSGSQFVSAGGTAYGTRLGSGAIQTVFSGGVASDTTVAADAFQYVLKDGSAHHTEVASRGICAVEYDGYGENITVADGGSIVVHGTVRNLTVARNAAYYFDMGTAVFQGDFDCYLRSEDLETLNEILQFSDLESLTLRVRAADFGTEHYNAFSTEYNNNIQYNFILVLADGTGVTLSNNEEYIYSGKSYSVRYDEAESRYLLTKTVVAPESAGIAGDLNADGRADIVMTIAQSGHGADGATGAWLIQSDQTAAWGDLSQRNAGWEIFGMGHTAANKATADVYVRSTNNVVGAWTTDNDGRVNGWETIGEFSRDTQIVGLGDFNGNGQTDLLLRNNNGAVGCYFTGGEKTGWNYFQSLGDEWKLCAVGDLNGDGRDDVVLKHDAGFAGSWLTQSDGTMAWADLDTLPDGFAIVGSGDFNGDGTDDVLLQKGSYFGAWLVQNGNAAGWMGLGDLPSVTVEQIADFDGDGTDDLRVRTAAGDLGAQLVKGADTLEWKYYGSVGSEWSTALAAL